ncbi:CD63 antigen [Exaiptasia diaphana]|uniref:Tetraspanin n=1 Tax=Exaiptasia diaphana TaxID=2652724 RepID=A0A913Y1N7_EXADI|nr:CD63 antigen [Exaiptasia diaphana]
MLCTFVILLAVLLILEIAAAALAYKHKDEFKNELNKALKKKIDGYRASNKTNDVDDAQEKLKCCGINSYKDWNSTAFNKGGQGNLPDSCCKKVSSGCGKGKLTGKPDGVYTEGCLSKLSNDFNKILSATGGIAIAILVIQILGIIFGLILFCQVRNNQDVKEIH